MILPTLPNAVKVACMLKLSGDHPDWPARVILTQALRELRG
jgi:hypothetical protein